MNPVVTDQTLRQLQQHGTSSFPISVSFVYLSEYKGMQFPHHWHDEFEFLLIHSGQMRCTANNESVVLDPGDAIFFNSGALHTGAAVAQKDCAYFAVTLHPDFFGMPGTALVENYITPFCDSPFFNFYKLAASREADQPVLHALNSVCALYNTQDICRDIDIYTQVLLLWKALFLCCRDSLSFDFYSSESERLHKMLSYIKSNYNQPITLDQIADAAGVSKSGCGHFFKRYMRESPFRFLLRYRVEKGCKLLLSTSMTVTEISAEVGLCTSSYFCETFKRIKGITPSEFRAQNR